MVLLLMQLGERRNWVHLPALVAGHLHLLGLFCSRCQQQLHVQVLQKLPCGGINLNVKQIGKLGNAECLMLLESSRDGVEVGLQLLAVHTGCSLVAVRAVGRLTVSFIEAVGPSTQWGPIVPRDVLAGRG